MGRSNRRSLIPKAKPYDQAFPQIDAMEKCCCYRTVTADFTVRDVCEWLWPKEILDKIAAATPYLYESYSYYDDMVALDGTPFHIQLDTEIATLYRPRGGVFQLQQTPKSPMIEKALLDIARIHRKFQNVRAVVAWLNDYATPGATRYYFPSILALLPEDHVLHRVTGEIHSEPRLPIATVAERMREAMTTIAMGLVSYEPVDNRAITNHMRVEVINADNTRSNLFHVI